MSVATWDEVYKKIKAELVKRGSNALPALARLFRIADDTGDRQLDKREFKEAMELYQLNLNGAEINAVFDKLDSDGNGTLNFDEFLIGLRGPLSKRRKALIRQAYNVLDKSGDGEVTLEDIKMVYNAKQHPKVISGEKTEDEILLEFMEVFEGPGGNHDGKVSIEEFEDYYANVSASVDDDNYFALVIEQAWKVKEVPCWENMDPEGFQKIIRSIQDKVQAKSQGGSEARALRSNFKFFDTKNDGTLKFADFRKAVERLGLNLSDFDITALFNKYDREGTKSIKYEEVVAEVTGAETQAATPDRKTPAASGGGKSSISFGGEGGEEFRPSISRGGARPKDSGPLW